MLKSYFNFDDQQKFRGEQGGLNKIFIKINAGFAFFKSALFEDKREYVEEKNLVKFLELQNLYFYFIIAQNREETN